MSTYHFRSPAFERLGHPQPEPEVKRAILASWAADACKLRTRPRSDARGTSRGHPGP